VQFLTLEIEIKESCSIQGHSQMIFFSIFFIKKRNASWLVKIFGPEKERFLV